MSGEHNGVRALFEDATPHFAYIHCHNHCPALCFAHLLPQFEDFEKFDGLLLNHYLLLKHSSIKQSIFEEVQNAYKLCALKLVKAAVTRWLSHGKAVQRVLDRYEALVASLDAIYLRKQEAAVRRLRDELIQPNVIATMCFLADVLQSTNMLQTILQGACLNFLQIPVEVNKLLNTLRSKADQLMEPPTCYFAKLNDISSRSAGVRFRSRSYEEFDIAKFNVTTVKPFIEALVKEIEEAFKIPEHLKGFTAIDLLLFPFDATNLQDFGKEGINSLASFYGQANSDAETVVLPVVNGQALVHQYKGCKVYVMKYLNE